MSVGVVFAVAAIAVVVAVVAVAVSVAVAAVVVVVVAVVVVVGHCCRYQCKEDRGQAGDLPLHDPDQDSPAETQPRRRR